MAKDLAARRAAFRALHGEGCFVLPNPWDVGSAVRLERMGFKALASTSSGLAWSMGREDGEVSRDEVLAHLRVLCGATELPVNADFEAGFADSPEGVAANVALAVQTGVAGLSIEDRIGGELYELALAVERMRAAREAIDAVGRGCFAGGTVGRVSDWANRAGCDDRAAGGLCERGGGLFVCAGDEKSERDCGCGEGGGSEAGECVVAGAGYAGGRPGWGRCAASECGRRTGGSGVGGIRQSSADVD